MENVEGFWNFKYSQRFFKWMRRFVSEVLEYINASDFEYDLPSNEKYQNKKGRKKNSERDDIKEDMFKENEVSIDRITGGTVKMVQDNEGVIGWDEVDVKMLVRSSELTEEDKEEILMLVNKKGERVFTESHFFLAKKVKGVWSEGKGRSEIVKKLKGVKGASDGYVGKFVGCFNRAREKRKAKLRKPEN